MKTLKLFMLILLALSTAAMALPSMQVQLIIPQPRDYTIAVLSGPIGVYDVGDTFRSFCLERSEPISGSVYNVELNTKAINGGVSPAGIGDPLDTKTAFLYSEFCSGGLTSLGFDETNWWDINVLQNVVWSLEGEGTDADAMATTLASDLLTYANNADGSLYGIRVMNLYERDGDLAQDFMVKIIPAPGAVILAGIGVSAVGWIRRRRK